MKPPEPPQTTIPTRTERQRGSGISEDDDRHAARDPNPGDFRKSADMARSPDCCRGSLRQLTSGSQPPATLQNIHQLGFWGRSCTPWSCSFWPG